MARRNILHSSPHSYIQASGVHPFGLCDVFLLSFLMLLNEHIPTIRLQTTLLQQYDLGQVLYNYGFPSLSRVWTEPLMIDLILVWIHGPALFGFMLL